ncbi:hypothetical protein E6R62_08885 [Streptomyces sp. A1136]|nr:hypothetical protein E6R62_08885 [Streptomyces sp. A1136]
MWWLRLSVGVEGIAVGPSAGAGRRAVAVRGGRDGGRRGRGGGGPVAPRRRDGARPGPGGRRRAQPVDHARGGEARQCGAREEHAGAAPGEVLEVAHQALRATFLHAVGDPVAALRHAADQSGRRGTGPAVLAHLPQFVGEPAHVPGEAARLGPRLVLELALEFADEVLGLARGLVDDLPRLLLGGPGHVGRLVADLRGALAQCVLGRSRCRRRRTGRTAA